MIDGVAPLEGARGLVAALRERGHKVDVAALVDGFSKQELGDAGAAEVFESLGDLQGRLARTPFADD